MEFYWELIQYDGTRVEIPPEMVPVIQGRMDRKEPIHTKTVGSIPTAQIQFFRPTSKPYGTQPLLEAVAHAFNEPMYNPDGSVVAQWVKFPVTRQKYEKYYSPSGYQKLGEEGGMVMVACFLPVHEIDVSRVSYCDESEQLNLEKRRKTKQ